MQAIFNTQMAQLRLKTVHTTAKIQFKAIRTKICYKRQKVKMLDSQLHKV